MAEMMVPIRSVKQYFKEFGVDAIGKHGADPKMVREQLLDAFQKEIFGQITMKYHDATILAKDADIVDDATREGVRNIIRNADRKWKRLCTLFATVSQTHTLIYPSELMERMHDIVKIQTEEAKGNSEPVDMGEKDIVEEVETVGQA